MYINVENINYHLKIIGSGAPVLCLHGFSQSLETWDFLKDFPKLSQNKFAFITLDLIGHGKSDKPEEIQVYTLEKILTHSYCILEKLSKNPKYNIKPVPPILLGYSLGGRIALNYAIKYPKTVHALILESANYGIADDTSQKSERQKHDSLLTQNILDNGIEWFENYWKNLPLFLSQKSLTPEIQKKIQKSRIQNSPLALANTLKATGQGTLSCVKKDIASLPMPILYVSGSLDEKYTKIGQEILTLHKNTSFICVENSGHCVHLEKPEEFCQILSNFLKNADKKKT